LRKSQALQSLIPIVLYHHEHFDGKGYPAGLTGPDIPLEARIVCLADSVDAMSSDRPYRRAYNFDEMMSEVRRCSGSQFDPVVVNAFEQVAEKLGPALIIPTNQSYLTKDKLDS
jgi:HD-GYP domain-containing protein (c-di-GMP phosphodiesterase class II)